jgi:uncharacterized protein (DUF58 family)
MTERPQLTALLPNAVLDRLERRRVATRARRTNRGRGEHLSGKGGASTEFCDYRDYSPGDDTRFVDWNIFARLHRPYLKQFHREEERHVVLLVDASASMQFEQKLERARQLAAAFGVLGLQNNERVSVFTTDAARRLPPCRGRASLRRLFAFLEQIEAGGDVPLEAAVETLLRHHRGRGVCVVLSDFLTFGDLTRAFNSLYATGLELLGLQVLGPAELQPELTGDVRLQDIETELGLDVSAAADLITIYQEYRESYEQQLRRACQGRAGRFTSVSSAAPLEWVLFDSLQRQGWIE